jgi:hypothetical protein
MCRRLLPFAKAKSTMLSIGCLMNPTLAAYPLLLPAAKNRRDYREAGAGAGMRGNCLAGQHESDAGFVDPLLPKITPLSAEFCAEP